MSTANPDSFSAYINYLCPTGLQFVVQQGSLHSIMEGTKTNWRWIQAEAKKRGLEYEIHSDTFDSLPESGRVTFVSPQRGSAHPA